MSSLRDYSLNFEFDKPSYQIEDQLPLFIRKDNPEFIAFLKEYYKFLETKIVKVTVNSADSNSMLAIEQGDLISSSHLLTCNDGHDPIIEISGFEYTPYMEWSESFVNSSVKDIAAVYDSYHQKSVIFYNDIDDDNKSKYIVISLNGTDIVPGPPSLFLEGAARKISGVFDPDTNKIIVSYLNESLNNNIFVVDCLIGNNTFSVGIPACVNSDISSHPLIVDLPDERFCVFYVNEGKETTTKISFVDVTFIGNNTTKVTAKFPIFDTDHMLEMCAPYYSFVPGDIITIAGAIGTEESKLNGTWEIQTVDIEKLTKVSATEQINVTSGTFIFNGSSQAQIKIPRTVEEYSAQIAICRSKFAVDINDSISIITANNDIVGGHLITDVQRDDDYYYISFPVNNEVSNGELIITDDITVKLFHTELVKPSSLEHHIVTFSILKEGYTESECKIEANTYTENVGTTTLFHRNFRKEITIGSFNSNSEIEIGERNVFSDEDLQSISIAYDNDKDRLIVSYNHFTKGYGGTRLVSINGDDIRIGKESIFNSGPSSDIFTEYIENGRHAVMFQDGDNNGYGTVKIGTININTNIIEYGQSSVFNEGITKDIKADYDTYNDKLIVVYNEVDSTSFGAARIIDISTDTITIGGKSVFSGFSDSSIDVYFDPILKKDIIFHGNEDISSGRVSIFNPYQFLFNILDPGEGIEANVAITLGDANEGSYGANATAVANALGHIEYIIVNHGFGYTECPPIINFDYSDDINVYLGEGTEDNPIIELSDYKSIDGKVIGFIDRDYDDNGTVITKDILIEHYSGALERAELHDNFGEVFNPDILNALSRNAAMPTIIDVNEIETPINAMHNMHNYGDIDYSFNSKLFLGNDLYSLMYKEIMKEWPNELVPSIENKIKSIIGRNISQFYKSLGTEDAIKFVFKLIFDKEAELWSPSDQLFSLNSGVWDTQNILNVRMDSEKDILESRGRMLYNISKITINNVLHDTIETLTITTETSHNLKSGTIITLLGDPYYAGNHEITVVDGTKFTIDVLYSLVNFSQPMSSLQISNYYGIVQNVEQTSNTTAQIYLSDLSGSSFKVGEYIKSTLSTGEEFECEILNDLVVNESYASNSNILNGSVIQDVPETFKLRIDGYEDKNIEEKWNSLNSVDKHLAGLIITDLINTDRIQDGDLYQLYSYVIKVKAKAPYLLDTYTEEEVKNSIKNLTHPAGFKVTIIES